MEEIETRCVACNQAPDHCQGGHGAPCEDCLGWAGNHVWQHAHMTGTMTCSGCGLLPLDGEDMETPCPASGAHEAYCPQVSDRPWVCVFFAQGESADEVWDAYGKGDEGLYAAMDYMAQWDFGEETDAAHTYEADEGDEFNLNPWGSSDTKDEVGQYVIAAGPKRLYVSMNRRALWVKP